MGARKGVQCTICRDTRVQIRVNRLLIQGLSDKKVAEKTGLGYKSIERHRRSHFAQRLAAARRHREVIAQADFESQMIDLLGLKSKCVRALDQIDVKAEPSGWASVAREGVKATTAYIQFLRDANRQEIASNLREVQLRVVYGEEEKRDMPQPAFEIVRESAPKRLPPPSVFVPAPEPAPPPKTPARPASRPAPPSGTMTVSGDGAGMPANWSKTLSGQRKM